MAVMWGSRLAVLVVCAFAAVSCDTSSPARRSTPTPAQEVARVPLPPNRQHVVPIVMSISPDGTRISRRGASGDATALPGASVAAAMPTIYNAATKQFEQPTLPVPPNEKLVAVHFSPDGLFQVGVYVGARAYREL